MKAVDLELEKEDWFAIWSESMECALSLMFVFGFNCTKNLKLLILLSKPLFYLYD
jgi:hypothetical protein